MNRGPDAAALLRHALQTSASHVGCPVRILFSNTTGWASATFTGARHHITLAAMPSPALSRWVAELPEAELPLRHHLVVEAQATRVIHGDDEVIIDTEFLTIEDRL